jgi:hypothetical protein
VEKLLARLERRYGKYAPEGITLWIVGLSGLLHLLVYAKPETVQYLWLDPDAVLRGEIWRIFTFLFAPVGPLSTLGLVLSVFGLQFLYTMGTALEGQWGSLTYDLFILIGAIFTLAAAFVVGPVPGYFIASAILMAFAVHFPDYQILFMFIVPIKVKWLGLLAGATMIVSLVNGSTATRVAVAIALGDFLLFCGSDLVAHVRRAAGGGRRKVPSGFGPAARRKRVCAKCGRSDADDPSLEFRVCDCAEKCHGKLTEYCLEHAKNH